MIKQPNSILPVLHVDDETPFSALQELVKPYLDAPGLNRLTAAVGHRTKTVLVERHYIDKDYRDTFSNYHSKKFHTPDSRCVRLHFFASQVEPTDLFESRDIASHGYIGYSVIRPIRPNCIGRTMLRPEVRPGLAGMLSLCQETVNLQGVELMVDGFPFISQDSDATVCAQATLWMLMRFLSNRYSIYPEVYPVQIGAMTRDYSVGRLFPTAGLYIWQMAEALRQINIASVIYSRNEYPDFEHLLYTYIESGIPVLAAFKDHVVVLLGHQSDYAATSVNPVTPKSSFNFSSAFNQAYIGNDDNSIPYQVLRRAMGRNERGNRVLLLGRH